MVFTWQNNWWVGIRCVHFRFTDRVLRQGVINSSVRLLWLMVEILARNVSPVDLPVFPHIVWIFHFPSYLEQVGNLLVSLPVHLQLDVPQDMRMVLLCLTGCVPGIPHNLHQTVLLISSGELLIDIAVNFDCVVGCLLQNITDTVLGDVDTGGQLQQIYGIHRRPGAGAGPNLLLPLLSCYIY